MQTSARLERYTRAHRAASFIGRTELREAVRLYMMEPETKLLFQGWVYELLCRTETDHGG